jgi:hypothetical protein
MRPRLTARADGWVAEYSGWNLRAEGGTEREAIDRLKRLYQDEKARDPEAWRVRMGQLLENPPPDWEVTEDDGEAYARRLQQLNGEMNADR